MKLVFINKVAYTLIYWHAQSTSIYICCLPCLAACIGQCNRLQIMMDRCGHNLFFNTRRRSHRSIPTSACSNITYMYAHVHVALRLEGVRNWSLSYIACWVAMLHPWSSLARWTSHRVIMRDISILLVPVDRLALHRCSQWRWQRVPAGARAASTLRAFTVLVTYLLDLRCHLGPNYLKDRNSIVLCGSSRSKATHIRQAAHSRRILASQTHRNWYLFPIYPTIRFPPHAISTHLQPESTGQSINYSTKSQP